VDIRSVFSQAVAGDFCGLEIGLNNIGTKLNVFGILLNYKI